MTTDRTDEFEAQRRHLFGLACRLLGSAEEAEDVVQGAFLRWAGADQGSIAVVPAWLAKVVTNLCLTRLVSARARREQYVGLWLPEPERAVGRVTFEESLEERIPRSARGDAGPRPQEG